MTRFPYNTHTQTHIEYVPHMHPCKCIDVSVCSDRRTQGSSGVVLGWARAGIESGISDPRRLLLPLATARPLAESARKDVHLSSVARRRAAHCARRQKHHPQHTTSVQTAFHQLFIGIPFPLSLITHLKFIPHTGHPFGWIPLDTGGWLQ